MVPALLQPPAPPGLMLNFPQFSSEQTVFRLRIPIRLLLTRLPR